MEKVIRNGKVAVLISYGFGAGWSTWNNADNHILLFHPKLVDMVESGKREEIDEEWVEENLGISDVYCGGAEDLEIEWLEEGTKFCVEEHDGSESLLLIDRLTLTA